MNEENPYRDDWDRRIAHHSYTANAATRLYERVQIPTPIDGDLLTRIRHENKTALLNNA